MQEYQKLRQLGIHHEITMINEVIVTTSSFIMSDRRDELVVTVLVQQLLLLCFMYITQVMDDREKRIKEKEGFCLRRW